MVFQHWPFAHALLLSRRNILAPTYCISLRYQYKCCFFRDIFVVNINPRPKHSSFLVVAGRWLGRTEIQIVLSGQQLKSMVPSLASAGLSGPCQCVCGSGSNQKRGLGVSPGSPHPICRCCHSPEAFALIPQARKRSGFYQGFGLHRGECDSPREESYKHGNLGKCCSFPSASVFAAHPFLPAFPLYPGVCVCCV